MPKFDDRFARQNRFGPPSGFPLTSSYSGIVHHLSGPNIYALTQTFHQRIMVGRSCHLAVSDLLPSLRMWVCHPNTRTYVRLLGPCFKTGQLQPFCQLPVSTSPVSIEMGQSSTTQHAVSWTNVPSYQRRGAISVESFLWIGRDVPSRPHCWPPTRRLPRTIQKLTNQHKQ